MHLTPRTLVLATGASARLFRLAAVDDAGAPIRWAHGRLLELLAGEDVVASEARLSQVTQWRIRTADALHEGFNCPFCMGFWIALGAVASGAAWGDTAAWQIAAGALTVNYVAAWANRYLDGREDGPADVEPA